MLMIFTFTQSEMGKPLQDLEQNDMICHIRIISHWCLYWEQTKRETYEKAVAVAQTRGDWSLDQGVAAEIVRNGHILDIV